MRTLHDAFFGLVSAFMFAAYLRDALGDGPFARNAVIAAVWLGLFALNATMWRRRRGERDDHE